MKKYLVPIVLIISLTPLYSQDFKSDRITAVHWETDAPLTLKAENNNDEIRIVALGKKQQRSQKKIKQVKINTESYQLVESCGAINVQNAKGETILKTNADRSEVVLPAQMRLTKRMAGGNKGIIEYLDGANQVIVSGQFRGGVIYLKNHSPQKQEALLALCLEELLQHAYDRYLHALMMSSFLAQTD